MSSYAYNKNIVYLGEINNEDIECLSNYSKNVFLDVNINLFAKNNIKKLCEIANENISAIIINGLTKLYRNHLDKVKKSVEHIFNNTKFKGVICLLQENPLYINNIFRITHDIYDLYLSFYLKKYNIKKNSEIYSIVYNKEIYESFPTNRYISNVNSTLLNEKIKKLLIRDPFSRYLFNSKVSIFSNLQNSSQYILINNLANHLIQNKLLKWKNLHDVKANKIYYKNGKVLISYSSHSLPEYIVVLCLDNDAYLQRINEKNSIENLRLNYDKNLLPIIYGPYEIDKLPYFIIEESSGYCIDSNLKELKIITIKCFDNLINLYYCSQSTELTFSSLTENLLDKIIERIPHMKKQFNLLVDEINTITTNKKYKTCILHGDYKIENSVVNNNREIIKIIDWELSDIHGVPLLDLIYLITYNISLIYDFTFYKSFETVLLNKLPVFYQNMLIDYTKKTGIDYQNIYIYFSVFYLHHFAKRYKFSNGSSEKEDCSFIIDILIRGLRGCI